jgi:hypothetical protein
MPKCGKHVSLPFDLWSMRAKVVVVTAVNSLSNELLSKHSSTRNKQVNRLVRRAHQGPAINSINSINILPAPVQTRLELLPIEPLHRLAMQAHQARACNITNVAQAHLRAPLTSFRHDKESLHRRRDKLEHQAYHQKLLSYQMTAKTKLKSPASSSGEELAVMWPLDQKRMKKLK